MKLSKIGKRGQMTGAQLLALGIGVLIVIGLFFGNPFAGTGGTEISEEQQQVNLELCGVPETTITSDMSKAFAPGTSVAGESALIKVDGEAVGTAYAEGGTFDTNPTAAFEILFAHNSTTYYAALANSERTADEPCLGGAKTTAQLAAAESELYEMANLSGRITVKSEDGTGVLAATNNQSISAGEQVSLPIEIKGVYQDAWSPYGSGAICLNYDTSADGYEYVRVLVDGVGELSAISKPMSFLTPTDVNSASVTVTDNALVCYDLQRGIISGDKITGSLEIKAKDSFTVEYIQGVLVDQDYYQNSITGAFEIGFQNNAGVGVGQDDAGTGVFTVNLAA